MAANFSQNPVPTDPDQIAAFEETNQRRLEGWWQAAGKEPHYPLGTADVADLMGRVDYNVSPDDLVAWAKEGIIPPVPMQNGRLAWSATNAVTAVCAADARRMWKAFSVIHAHKFSMIEKLRQILESRGQPAFNDLAKFDVQGLLGVLVQVSSDQGAVQVIAEALRCKLQTEGVI